VQLVTELVTTYTPTANAKGVPLNVRMNVAGSPIVIFDRNCIRKVRRVRIIIAARDRCPS
jgi:hypothetical protein